MKNVVLITGASQGIGAAIAERFARASNYQLALLARNSARLQEVARHCEALGAEALPIPTDVTREEDVRHACERVTSRYGVPHVLINNAGRFLPGSTLETSVEQFREQIEVNLTSAFIVTHTFLPLMLRQGEGHIFFMGSVASIRAYPNGAAYCAAKHGLLGLARVVREETRQTGIRVTSLLPGATLTPSWEGTDLPPERFMPPEDIAELVFQVYRLSPRTDVEEVILRPQLGDI